MADKSIEEEKAKELQNLESGKTIYQIEKEALEKLKGTTKPTDTRKYEYFKQDPEVLKIKQRVAALMDKLKSLANIEPELKDKISDILQKMSSKTDEFCELSRKPLYGIFRKIRELEEQAEKIRLNNLAVAKQELEELIKMAEDLVKEIEKDKKI